VETPFFLVYGAKVVLSPEDAKGSPRVVTYEEAVQVKAHRDDLDLLEEKRCCTNVWISRHHQALKSYHQRTIQERALHTSDLVLQRILNREGMNKLSNIWEGPFRVSKVYLPGSFWLEMEDGIPLPNP
jgi:hypothetical protein